MEVRNDVTTKEAMAVITQAMINDNPSELGSYAHSWHCNIAMACYDAIQSVTGENAGFNVLAVSNDSASRFMRLCFGVETKQV